MSGRRAARGLLHYLGVGLSAGLLAIVLGVAALVVVVPWVSGAVPLTVLTSSMEPHLPPGTLVVVRPAATEDIRVGSIVTYQIESGKPAVVTHRVVEVLSSTDGTTRFVTQGDNNPQPDPQPVVPEQIKGTVWYSVPLLGYLAQGVNGEGRSWLVTVAALALLAYSGYTIASGIRGRKRKAAARSSHTDRTRLH